MICLVGLSFSTLFATMQFPGASEVLLVVSILFLIYAATDGDKLNLAIGTLAALALALGLFFKMQLLPGASQLINVAMGLLLPAYFVAYFVRLK